MRTEQRDIFNFGLFLSWIESCDSPAFTFCSVQPTNENRNYRLRKPVFSVERAWGDVFPSRAAVQLGALPARQEARKATCVRNTQVTASQAWPYQYVMSHIRSKNTRREKKIRQELHALGFRYRSGFIPDCV